MWGASIVSNGLTGNMVFVFTLTSSSIIQNESMSIGEWADPICGIKRINIMGVWSWIQKKLRALHWN